MMGTVFYEVNQVKTTSAFRIAAVSLLVLSGCATMRTAKDEVGGFFSDTYDKAVGFFTKPALAKPQVRRPNTGNLPTAPAAPPAPVLAAPAQPVSTLPSAPATVEDAKHKHFQLLGTGPYRVLYNGNTIQVHVKKIRGEGPQQEVSWERVFVPNEAFNPADQDKLVPGDKFAVYTMTGVLLQILEYKP